MDGGPWAGRTVLGLSRSTSLLDRVGVAQGAAGPVTLLEVVGDGGVDVRLVLGEPAAAPGDVLTAGISAVTRQITATGASRLPEGEPGPGLTVQTVPSATREPRLDVRTVAFDVRGEHDLLRHARLFGLRAASAPDGDHFPGISSVPLTLGSARQSALARFHAEGFEAAAVNAVAFAAAGVPCLPYRTRRVCVRFHRPFGFLAVHRTSRLVLAAGWVTEPLAYDSPDHD
ncbi:hypothetical protein ABZ128_04560 [Streptomyces sp. NPDC006326]|uniref:hypothetical protein n=1 Tax=Streptomyces sp. NPDC006326 TaxID=3156752 RepID=UPI0033AD5EBD